MENDKVLELKRVYYIKKVYKYKRNGKPYQTTFVRIETNTGSKLYRIGKRYAMLFESEEIANKYRKEGEQISHIDFKKKRRFLSSYPNPDSLVDIAYFHR